MRNIESLAVFSNRITTLVSIEHRIVCTSINAGAVSFVEVLKVLNLIDAAALPMLCLSISKLFYLIER
jgi:hypothetical protein